MQPLVSVTIMTYNSGKTVYRTIDSVIDQRYTSIEIIVSDDGSSDFCADEVEKYIEKNKGENIKRYLVLANSRNVGTVRHANYVMKRAHGDYLIDLAADDVFYDNTIISKIVKKMESNNIELLATRRLVCDNDLKPMYYMPHFFEGKTVERLKGGKKQYEAFVTNRFYDMASGSALAYKRELVSKLNFDENYVLIEDFPFITNYSWNKDIYYCHEIVSIKYRLGGISNTVNPTVAKDMELYNSKDRIAHYDVLSNKAKRRIDYILDRYKVSEKNELLLIYLKYIDVFISKVSYTLRRFIGKMIDKMIVRITEK